MTLYTARPEKDREFYEKGQKLPLGVFLTTDSDFATGFGLDYNEQRDIWKVKIDSSYLIKTMDSPQQKQYQVVKEAPVKMYML